MMTMVSENAFFLFISIPRTFRMILITTGLCIIPLESSLNQGILSLSNQIRGWAIRRRAGLCPRLRPQCFHQTFSRSFVGFWNMPQTFWILLGFWIMPKLGARGGRHFGRLRGRHGFPCRHFFRCRLRLHLGLCCSCIYLLCVWLHCSCTFLLFGWSS